ncbi:MAG: hypothetical protein ACFBSD_08890 [Paracoccaceae bacterium]
MREKLDRKPWEPPRIEEIRISESRVQKASNPEIETRNDGDGIVPGS